MMPRLPLIKSCQKVPRGLPHAAAAASARLIAAHCRPELYCSDNPGISRSWSSTLLYVRQGHKCHAANIAEIPRSVAKSSRAFKPPYCSSDHVFYLPVCHIIAALCTPTQCCTYLACLLAAHSNVGISRQITDKSQGGISARAVREYVTSRGQQVIEGSLTSSTRSANKTCLFFSMAAGTVDRWESKFHKPLPRKM